jgi:hypothetical protein
MSRPAAYFRLVRAGWILTREGVVAAMPGDQLSGLPKLGWRIGSLLARRRSEQRQRSERLARAIERLGPSYIKLGQFLATRPDVVGRDMAADLASLQDNVDTFPRAEAVAAIEGSLGRPIADLYTSFGEPVASANRWRRRPLRRFIPPMSRMREGRRRSRSRSSGLASGDASRTTSKAISSRRICRSATSVRAAD